MQVRKRPSTARQRPVARSASLFGAIKNIVGWFSNTTDGDVADAQGKRKEAGGRQEEDEDERGRKRKRVESPDRESIKETDSVVGVKQQQQVYRASSSLGYLDPPSTFLAPPTSRHLAHGRSASLAAPPRHHPYSGSVSPPPQTYQANTVARTQSMDPPPRRRVVIEASARAPSSQPLRREASMSVDPEYSGADNLFRDVTRSPGKYFRMRTSLTPQPAGQGFGPHPQRRDRLPSEPPPLTALIEKPVFVRAPKDQARDGTEGQRVSQGSATLGTIAESRRSAQPVQRSFSSLHIGSDSSMQDIETETATPVTYPITAAARTLRELELYKTPLVPTRLRSSASGTGVPDMFRTKAMQAPVLMQDREKKPRLGTAEGASPRKKGDKLKEMEEESAKPYAGKGGMKRLLERRRQEEEESERREQEEEERNDKGKGRLFDEDDEMDGLPQHVEPAQPPMSAAAELGSPKKLPIGGREQSSLRVGRTRISKAIARPQMKLRGAGGRFSAIFEDDEGDDAMDDGRKELEEAAKKVPVFNIPPGFSFAKDNAAAPLSQDAKAKEPPISSLPFSLMKPAAPPQKSSPVAPLPISSQAVTPATVPVASESSFTACHPVTVAAESATVLAPAPSTPMLSSVPGIAFIPPTPDTPLTNASSKVPSLAQPSASMGDASVPNFFKGSGLFNSPTPKVNASAFSLFGNPPAKTDVTTSITPTLGIPAAVAEGNAKPASAPLFDVFGAPSSSSTLTSTNVESKPLPVVSEAPKPSQSSSLFGWPKASEPSRSELGADASKDEPAAAASTPAVVSSTPFSFGGNTTTTTPGSSLPFSFGSRPTETTAAPTTTAPTNTPFSFGTKPTEASAAPTASSTLFSFGAPPKIEAPKETERPASTPFTFGTSPSPVPPEPSKSPFTFGAPLAQTAHAAPATVGSAASSPVIQAPKPLFGGSTGFNFGQSSVPNTSAPEAPKSPFTFSGTPAPEERRPSFTFGSPSPAPPSSGSTLFGNAGGSTNGGGPSNPFSFGAPSNQTSTRPSTPPKMNGDSEVMMDESPSKEDRPSAPASSGFSFGSGAASNPFGSVTTNNGTGAAPFSFGNSAGASNPFGAKPDTKPAFGGPTTATTNSPFSFGSKPAESTSSAPFSFGSKPAEPSAAANPFSFGSKPAEPTTPSAGGNAFSFNSPVTPTVSNAPFGFGAPPQIAQSTSFGATSAPSAPASPNPFGQPLAGGSSPAFSFGAAAASGNAGATPTPTSATAPGHPFAFGGSQPASPAATSVGLPSTPGGAFSFGAGASGTMNATGSPFSPISPLPQPSGGGALFNIGSAPPPTPGGTRMMKKLPQRRGGVKR